MTTTAEAPTEETQLALTVDEIAKLRKRLGDYRGDLDECSKILGINEGTFRVGANKICFRMDGPVRVVFHTAYEESGGNYLNIEITVKPEGVLSLVHQRIAELTKIIAVIEVDFDRRGIKHGGKGQGAA